MTQSPSVAFFEQSEIRKVWQDERWYFSVVDVVAVLTESSDPKDYWYRMKIRVKNEDGSELSTICRQLKLPASDGKRYVTDCADTQSLLRIIQSIPSPRAEPFKIWLAKVGYERIEEISNPEIALNRSRELWQKHGRSAQWIEQRMIGQETRNKLTDYWSDHGVEKGLEYAILTNIIHAEWAEIDIAKYKSLK